MANNAKIKAAGIAPVIQTYGDTWTSQLFVLGDYHNVAGDGPRLGDEVHAQPGQVRRSRPRSPASSTSRRSTRRATRTRTTARSSSSRACASWRPARARSTRCSRTRSPRSRRRPRQQVDDIGFFALPGDDAAKNGLTLWLPGAAVHPQDDRGRQARGGEEVRGVPRHARRDATRRARRSRRRARTWSRAATCPTDLPPAVKDLTAVRRRRQGDARRSSSSRP